MINNPINATKGKHTFHLPLRGFYRNLSEKIWMENCANLNVCGLETVSTIVGIPLVTVVAGDMSYMTKIGEKFKHFTNLRRHQTLSVVRGSVFVFSVTQMLIPYLQAHEDTQATWAQQRPLSSKMHQQSNSQISTSELAHLDHFLNPVHIYLSLL